MHFASINNSSYIISFSFDHGQSMDIIANQAHSTVNATHIGVVNPFNNNGVNPRPWDEEAPAVENPLYESVDLMANFTLEPIVHERH